VPVIVGERWAGRQGLRRPGAVEFESEWMLFEGERCVVHASLVGAHLCTHLNIALLFLAAPLPATPCCSAGRQQGRGHGRGGGCGLHPVPEPARPCGGDPGVLAGIACLHWGYVGRQLGGKTGGRLV